MFSAYGGEKDAIASSDITKAPFVKHPTTRPFVQLIEAVDSGVTKGLLFITNLKYEVRQCKQTA